MSEMITCEFCGIDTDLSKSKVCANCGAQLEKKTKGPEQEKLVPPVWGELSFTIIDKEAIERESAIKFISDIWDTVQAQQLTTILPRQVVMGSKSDTEVKLLCHSGIATKIKFEIEKSIYRAIFEIKFIEISDQEFDARLAGIK